MADQESAPRAKPPAKRTSARKSTSASKPAAAQPAAVEPETPTKTCPLCAERIQAAAVICRHCGADFRTPAAAAGGSHSAYGPPPPAGAGYRPPTPGAGYAPQSAGTNGFAIASLVLGLVWVWAVGSILAVIFGHVARKQIREAHARGHYVGGEGLATAGLVLGYLGIVGTIILTIAVVSVSSSTSCTPYPGYC